MTNANNFKVKVVKSDNDCLSNIKKKINYHLNVLKLQTYFPILSTYFDFYNGSKTQFTLKSRYYIKDILEKEEMISIADHIICISDSTKKDLQKFYNY